MNAHHYPALPSPPQTLFSLPPSLNLAYPAHRGAVVPSVFVPALGRPMAKKNSFYAERSRNVYENKENMDIMPGKYADICAQVKPFLQDIPALVRTICRDWRFRDATLREFIVTCKPVIACLGLPRTHACAANVVLPPRCAPATLPHRYRRGEWSG